MNKKMNNCIKGKIKSKKKNKVRWEKGKKN